MDERGVCERVCERVSLERVSVSVCERASGCFRKRDFFVIHHEITTHQPKATLHHSPTHNTHKMSNSTNWRRAPSTTTTPTTTQTQQKTEQPPYHTRKNNATTSRDYTPTQRAQQTNAITTKQQIHRKRKLKLRVWGDSFMGPVRMNGATNKK